MIVKFKKLSNTAITPHRAHHNDAGYDLFSDEDVELQYGETKVVSTGISLEIPKGYYADVRPRSGLTSKTALRVHLGTIDSDYRGKVGIICENHFEKKEEGNDFFHNYLIKQGDKIGQLVIHKLPEIELVETQELSDSERGLNGFGSTDKKEGK